MSRLITEFRKNEFGNCLDLELADLSSKIMNKLNLEKCTYDYIVFEYIPNQGEEDMNMFINLGLDPFTYILWKLYDGGYMKESFIEPFKSRIKEVFNIKI